jgi:DNA invertase Pin-like site-specific DNA recombinase
MNTYAYVRISTDQQSNDRQELILQEHGFNRENSIFFEEIFTGKTKKRPLLTEMLGKLEKGDRVVITDLSRLSRSLKDLLEIVEVLNKKECTLLSIKENLDLSTSTGKFILNVMGAIYQFERDTLSERTIDSLRAKKQNGVILGRPLANDVSAILDLHDQGKKAKEIAQETGININTVYHHIRKERK